MWLHLPFCLDKTLNIQEHRVTFTAVNEMHFNLAKFMGLLIRRDHQRFSFLLRVWVAGPFQGSLAEQQCSLYTTFFFMVWLTHNKWEGKCNNREILHSLCAKNERELLEIKIPIWNQPGVNECWRRKELSVVCLSIHNVWELLGALNDSGFVLRMVPHFPCDSVSASFMTKVFPSE